MLTPYAGLWLSRIAVATGGCGLLILTLGPFQGVEQRFGLTDKLAHAIAFYALSLGLFLSAPRSRRTDLSLLALLGGGLLEVAQGFSGRAMSSTDFLANAAGIFAAWAPGFIEQCRQHMRERPHISFPTIMALDHRRRRLRSSSSHHDPGQGREQ